MDITISSRHTQLSEALVAATHEKLSRLERMDGRVQRAEVHFYEEAGRRTPEQVCEVWMDGSGRRFQCKAAARDGFVAVDRAVTKLEHQLSKTKTRRSR